MTEISRQPIELARLERELSRLPCVDRDAFLLKVRDGMTYAAIGIQLGITPERAEAHVVCALIKLDAALTRERRPWWRFW